jgi:hypothetical protein
MAALIGVELTVGVPAESFELFGSRDSDLKLSVSGLRFL